MKNFMKKVSLPLDVQFIHPLVHGVLNIYQKICKSLFFTIYQSAHLYHHPLLLNRDHTV